MPQEELYNAVFRSLRTKEDLTIHFKAGTSPCQFWRDVAAKNPDVSFKVFIPAVSLVSFTKEGCPSNLEVVSRSFFIKELSQPNIAYIFEYRCSWKLSFNKEVVCSLLTQQV